MSADALHRYPKYPTYEDLIDETRTTTEIDMQGLVGAMPEILNSVYSRQQGETLVCDGQRSIAYED